MRSRSVGRKCIGSPETYELPVQVGGLCSWFGLVNLIPQYFSYLKVISDYGHVQRR